AAAAAAAGAGDSIGPSNGATGGGTKAAAGTGKMHPAVVPHEVPRDPITLEELGTWTWEFRLPEAREAGLLNAPASTVHSSSPLPSAPKNGGCFGGRNGGGDGGDGLKGNGIDDSGSASGGDGGVGGGGGGADHDSGSSDSGSDNDKNSESGGSGGGGSGNSSGNGQDRSGGGGGGGDGGGGERRCSSLHVTYNVESLCRYLLDSGDFKEPTTRVPFTESQLAELDKVANKAGMKLPGTLLEAFREREERYRAQRERREMLLGAERCLGDIVAEMRHVVEGAAAAEEGHLQILVLFPQFGLQFAELRAADAAFARQCLEGYAHALRGPPNCRTCDRFGLLGAALSYFNDLKE
ncbi:unnamed protein product, partial [Phaeothamnion confervicola]